MSELLQHPRLIIEVVLAYWLFNSFVSGMPKPKADDSQFWYGWLYTSLHTFAGNISQAAHNPAIQKALGINTEEQKG